MFGTNPLLSFLTRHAHPESEPEAALPTTSLQRHRLPEPEQMQGMELAWRENNHLSVTERWRFIQENVVLFLGLVTGGTLALHLCALFPLPWVFLAGASLGLLLALAHLGWAEEMRWSHVFLSLLVPPLAVVPAAFLATNFLAQRGLASLTLLGGALALFFSSWCRAHPVAFWRAWLLCAEWLKPATRHTFRERLREDEGYLTRATARVTRNGIFALLVLVSVVGLGGYSTRLAAFVLLLIGLFFTDFRPWQVARFCRQMLAYALTYTGQESGAAGVFLPQASLRQRIWFAGLTVGLLHLALSTGLTLYVPTQLVVPKPVLAAPVPTPTPKKQAPTGRRRSLPSPAPTPAPPTPQAEPLPRSLLNETPDTYAGVRAFLRASWQTKSLSWQGVFDFLLFPLLCAVVLPNLLLLAALRGYCLESEDWEEIIAELDDPEGRTTWQWRVDRLRDSLHEATDQFGNAIHERMHLFFGDEYSGRFAIIAPKAMLRGHCYICGTTGGNKTSIGIMGLLLQVMVGHTKPQPQEPLPPPVVIIDPKGDMAAMQTAKAQAEANGQKFRVFTPEQMKATHHFLAFATLRKAWRTPIQLCQLVLEAIGLAFGTGYGRGYFGGVARSALLQALQHPSQPQTFVDLHKIVARLRKSSAFQDCLELLNMIEALAQYPQLGPTDQEDHMIDFNQVLEAREVVYFWLPMSEPMASADIARLAVAGLFTAALDRQRAGLPTVETYLVLDEFQRIVARSLEVILQQARSAGIVAILANQSLQDLKTPDADLRTLVKTCTRVQMYFSVTEYEARMLAEMGGKELTWLKSVGESTTRIKFRRQRSRTVSYMESWQERLPLDRILSVSSDQMGMIVCFGIDGGYARYGGRPVLVRTHYPLPENVYAARLQAEWPALAEAAPVARPAVVPVATAPSSRAAAMDQLLATEVQAWLH